VWGTQHRKSWEQEGKGGGGPQVITTSDRSKMCDQYSRFSGVKGGESRVHRGAKKGKGRGGETLVRNRESERNVLTPHV